MKSSIDLCIKFLIITIIGVIIPQLLILAMVLFKPFWMFFETDMLVITIFLFLMYYIVFSIKLGIKSYRYLKKVSVAIIMFIVLNFCHFLCFYFALYIITKKLSIDPFGIATILLVFFLLMIISILIFSITLIITKVNFKKQNFIGSKTKNNSI